MSDDVPNPPAFPLTNWDTAIWPKGAAPGFGTGMTFFDYHAAHCPITFTEFMTGWKRSCDASTSEAMDAYAQLRFRYAAAMLKARKEFTNG